MNRRQACQNLAATVAAATMGAAIEVKAEDEEPTPHEDSAIERSERWDRHSVHPSMQRAIIACYDFLDAVAEAHADAEIDYGAVCDCDHCEDLTGMQWQVRLIRDFLCGRVTTSPAVEAKADWLHRRCQQRWTHVEKKLREVAPA